MSITPMEDLADMAAGVFLEVKALPCPILFVGLARAKENHMILLEAFPNTNPQRQIFFFQLGATYGNKPVEYVALAFEMWYQEFSQDEIPPGASFTLPSESADRKEGITLMRLVFQPRACDILRMEIIRPTDDIVDLGKRVKREVVSDIFLSSFFTGYMIEKYTRRELKEQFPNDYQFVVNQAKQLESIL